MYSSQKLFAVFAFLVYFTLSAKLYDDYQFQTLEHLSDASPYFIPQIPAKDPDAPPGCKITRAAYLIRNGGVYTDPLVESDYIAPFVAKLHNASNHVQWCNVNATEFAFLHTWKPPFNASNDRRLARAGKLEAAQLGVQIQYRYPSFSMPAKVWAAQSRRAFKTAENLARGLELDDGSINVIFVPLMDASNANASNTLLSHQSCGGYKPNAGAAQAQEYIQRYTAPILARFEALVPGFGWTAEDVLAMQEICGYETIVSASSQFCSTSLFSSDEWLYFEYAKDLMFHFNTGYGNADVAGALGHPWVNSMFKLLTAPASEKMSGEQDMYISVAHADLVASVMVTLGLFNNSAFSGANDMAATMPLDRVNHERAWVTSDIVPFLGNVQMEKLNCSEAYGYRGPRGDYYRVLVNEAPQPLIGCVDGPAESCSRAGLERLWSEKTARFGDWAGVCGGQGGGLDIFWGNANGTNVG